MPRPFGSSVAALAMRTRAPFELRCRRRPLAPRGPVTSQRIRWEAPVLDAAFALAAMRATGSYAVTERDRAAAEKVAATLGRRVAELQSGSRTTLVALGFADGYEPNAGEEVFSVRRLSPIPLVALATCIGLCWTDIDEPPFPGAPAAVNRVLEVAAELGAPRSHLLGALRNELTMAGL